MRRASPSELRAAVVCLINRARGHWDLPRLRQQSQLDRAAQLHADQMAGDQIFSHRGARGSDPGLRLDLSGFRWSAFGETIATGFSTPVRAVLGWLASTEHCQILLSPSYREVGIGVSPRRIRRIANRPGTWAADFALPAGRASASRNWGPANGCPY